MKKLKCLLARLLVKLGLKKPCKACPLPASKLPKAKSSRKKSK